MRLGSSIQKHAGSMGAALHLHRSLLGTGPSKGTLLVQPYPAWFSELNPEFSFYEFSIFLNRKIVSILVKSIIQYINNIIFQLIWSQTEFCLSPNQSENGKYNWISIDLIWIRGRFLCVQFCSSKNDDSHG